jgi:hypothetical protein
MDLMVQVRNLNTSKIETDIYLFEEKTLDFKLKRQFKEENGGIFIADLGESRGMDIVYFDHDEGKRKFLWYNGTDPIE